MSPIMFETILFLKLNKALWDPHTVQKAYDIHIKEKRDERVKKRLAAAEEQEQDLNGDVE